MKKKTWYASAVLIVLMQLGTFGSGLHAGCCRSKPNEAETKRQGEPQLTPEKDKTDIFAIPLDLSEEEENQEMKNLGIINNQK